MRQRCFDKNFPQYKHYGGRGITICKEWGDSFEAFYADMGPRPTLRHTLDRIDNDKGYFPGNVRWATRQEQPKNRRTNYRFLVNGEVMLLKDIARMFGLNRLVVSRRLRSGMGIGYALLCPHYSYLRLWDDKQ